MVHVLSKAQTWPATFRCERGRIERENKTAVLATQIRQKHKETSGATGKKLAEKDSIPLVEGVSEDHGLERQLLVLPLLLRLLRHANSEQNGGPLF